MLNPSTTLLNDTTNANVEIVQNSVQHLSGNFFLNIFFQCLSCPWIILVYSVFKISLKKVVRGFRSAEYEGQRLYVRREINMFPGQYCLRYWRVPSEQRRGTTSWWNTTVLKSMAFLLLKAETNFLCFISMYRFKSAVSWFPSFSSKKYWLKIPLLIRAHHTVTFSWLNSRWVCSWD